MTIRINCPSCQASFAVDDGLRGKKIRCKKCEEVFAVQPNGGRGDSDDDRQPDRRVAAKPAPKAPARRPRDEDEDERPARKPARARDDEETPERRPPSRVRASRDDDAPRRRPSRDRDDDDDERPIRKRKKEGMPVGLLLGIGGGALLLLGGLIAGIVFALAPTGASSTAQVNAPPVGNQFVNNPNGMVGDPPKPPVREEPKGLPNELGPDALQRVKDSTVYLRVDLPGGGIAQGTGFFAVEPGVIVTNAHVLGMLTPDSLAPKSVTVKVHHGEPKEFELKGIVLGVDRANDLAVLRTDAASPLPPPLSIEPAARLTETQKVWIFGFPLGVRLGKNITVSPSSVTSLRKDPAGVINQVQVSGGMQPGNSGGPVSNSRGEVVGVSVSIIQGTQLAFAIPGEFVTRVLAGGISRQEFGTPYTANAGGQTAVSVRMRALDPLQRIRKVEVDLWTGAAGENLPATDKEPPARPGDGPRKRFAATAQGGGFTAEAELPPLPAGQFYWAQPVLVNASGVTTWAAASAVPFDPALVIERKPALLQFKAPTGPIQRTLLVKSNRTINVFGLDEPLAISEKMEGYALEASAPETPGPGTRTQLYLGRPRFTREAGGKVAEAPLAIGAMLARLSPSYLIAPNNSVTNFVRPGLNTIPAASQEAIGDLFDTACNTYEATTIPLPNKMVRPQETWAARVPMLISTGPPRQQVRMIGKRRVVTTIPSKKEARALNLTCTYEGTRTVDGIPQGYVLLTGVVNGVRDKAGEVYGKVSGHALVNLESGMLARVKTTISLEMESESSGARLLLTNENLVDRVEGNTQNIQIPKAPPPVVKKEVPPGWKEHKPKNNSFLVWLPESVGESRENNPVVQVKKIPNLKLQITELTAGGKGGAAYTASVIDANPLTALAIAGKGTTIERIDWLRDFLQESSKGKISGQKLLKLGRLEGKEFLIERGRAVTRYRVYMFVNKYFMVSITGTKAQVESKDAATFLDSYTIPIAFTGPIAPVMKEKDEAKPKE